MIAKHCRVHIVLFPQRRVAREGMNVVRVRDKEQERRERGRERERKKFNVCLPREAIKINTSNYQAVLNLNSQCSTPSILSSSNPTYPPSTNLAEILSPSDDKTYFAAFTCIYFQGGSAITRWKEGKAFVNVKEKNPPVKVYTKKKYIRKTTKYYIYIYIRSFVLMIYYG